jgi:hypothetical protein
MKPTPQDPTSPEGKKLTDNPTLDEMLKFVSQLTLQEDPDGIQVFQLALIYSERFVNSPAFRQELAQRAQIALGTIQTDAEGAIAANDAIEFLSTCTADGSLSGRLRSQLTTTFLQKLDDLIGERQRLSDDLDAARKERQTALVSAVGAFMSVGEPRNKR